MATVTATDLARNTREILDRVATRGEVVIVERNSAPIAQISLPQRQMTAAQALAGLAPIMRPEQGAAWLKDSRGDFDESIVDPWA